jgi:hypothetical protein
MCSVDGSRVIECGIMRNLDGEVTLDFAAEGVGSVCACRCRSGSPRDE